MGFWIALFHETVASYTDSELDLLDNTLFLIDNIDAVHAISPALNRDEANAWLTRRNQGLQIIGALKILTDGDDSAAAKYLATVVDSEYEDTKLRLAAGVIRLLHRDAIVVNAQSPELADRLLSVILRNDDIASVRHRVDVEHYPIEDRFYAATDYLMWSAGLPRSAAVLEPAILPAVRQFYERLKQTPTADLDYGTNYPVEWSLLRILMQTRSASGSGFKSAAEPLLSDIFSLDEDKLDRAGLRSLAAEWPNGRKN